MSEFLACKSAVDKRLIELGVVTIMLGCGKLKGSSISFVGVVGNDLEMRRLFMLIGGCRGRHSRAGAVLDHSPPGAGDHLLRGTS